jgi:hypothetical protein
MYFLEPIEEWKNIHPDDLWIYNKLILSTKLGYKCGPTGVPVPQPGNYIVRPSMNLLGMGRNARIEWLEESTDHLHPAEFWCEIFKGEHLSIDFYKKEVNLAVLGIKEENQPLYKWERWKKTKRKIGFPPILSSLIGNYDWINCEFIGKRLIEVHFRRNPDFRYGNEVAIPVWDEKSTENNKYRYIEDEDYLRKGFYID